MVTPVSAEALAKTPLPGLDDGDRWDRVITAAEAWALKEREAWDKYVRLFRDGTWLNTPERSKTPYVNANYAFAYSMMQLGMLYAQDPSIEVEPRDSQDSPSRRAFLPLVQAGLYQAPDGDIGKALDQALDDYADSLEKYLTYGYQEAGSNFQNQATLFETITRGQGVSKLSFDEKRGFTRCDALRRDELYLDPHARFVLTQAQYVIHIAMLPIEQAREFFAARGVTEKIEPNYSLQDGDGLEAEKAKTNMPRHDEKDLYKFYEIWRKDGDQRKLDYRAYREQKWLSREDWPFELDYDDFPFSLLAFQRQYTQASDAFTDLHTVEGLRMTIDRLIQFAKQHTGRSLAKKILLDEKVWADEKVKQIKDPVDMKFVTGKLDPGQRIEDTVFKLDFNSQTDASFDLARQFKEIMDEILGRDEMMKGLANRDMSATQADIMEKYGQARIGRKQKEVDAFLNDQCRKRAQIDTQLVHPQKIAAIVGQKAALLWSVHKTDAADLTGEFSVGIAAGSTGERAKQQRMERMNRMKQDAANLNQMHMQMGQPPRYDVDRISMDLWKQDGQRNPERYLLPAPPPQQMAPPLGMPGQAPAQAVPPGGQRQPQAPNVIPMPSRQLMLPGMGGPQEKQA